MSINTSNLQTSQNIAWQRQHSDMNWVIGLQAVGLYQNAKLRQEVTTVQKAIEKQTEFLKESHQETKGIMEKQLELLEAEQNRKQIERNTKQAIFSLKQTIKLIDSTESNLSRYLLAKTTHEIFIDSKFSVDSLEDVEDKEYFQDAIELLGNRATDSVKNLSTEELEILNTVAENHEKHNSLKLIQYEYSEILKDLNLSKGQASWDVGKRVVGEQKKNNNILSIKMGVVLFILGVIGIANEKSVSQITGWISAFLFIFGILIVPYVILRNIKQAALRYKDNSDVKSSYISSLNDKLTDCIVRARSIVDNINTENFSNLLH